MEPFSSESLKAIFQFVSQDSNRLISRENSLLEFKEAFNWSNRDLYCKSLAAFANARGGYIVFGVKDKPRDLVGLQNNRFEEMDPARVTEHLNTQISPELDWDWSLYEVNTMKVGLIYVYEAQRKPVLMMRNSSEFKESDIFYRYRGRSERIKYAELKRLIEDERQKEAQLWRTHIQQIATIGVHQASIFDSSSGELTDGQGKTFLIDQSLIPKLKFVREGKFSETAGTPTLRLIGDLTSASSVQPVRQKVKYKNIRTTDITVAFLKSEKPEDPLEYFRSICTESSAYLPIYYFLHLSKLSPADAIQVLEELESKSQSTPILLKRLSQVEDFTPTSTLNSGTVAAAAKLKYLKLIKSKNLPLLQDIKDIKYLLESIRYCKKADLEWDYLSPYLINIMKNCMSISSLSDPFRRAICHLDILFYQSTVRKRVNLLDKIDGAPVEPIMTKTSVAYLTGLEIKIGQRVLHPSFGFGTVVKKIGTAGKEIVQVAFGNDKKLLDPKFAKLSAMKDVL